MTRLSDLKRRLERLRRRRRRIRWSTGWAAILLAAGWALAAIFLVDWLLELSRAQRVVLLAVGAGAVAWAVRRWAAPYFGHRETELDMALLVERQHRIDTDLVAAVEFEWPEAPAWGSVALEDAVVRRAAEQSRRLDVFAGLSRRELARRSAALAATAALWALAAILWPAHVRTFFERLALGARHYPTQTRITDIVINGRRVEDPERPARTRIRCAWGQSAEFEVACAGRLPEAPGEVRLRALAGGSRATAALEPVAGRPGVYAAVVPRLVESVEYQIFLGDAWTDPAPILVTSLPNVHLDVLVVPPSYAKKSEAPIRMPSGLRQISVVEGSQVLFELGSDKWLKQVVVRLGDQEYPFRRVERPQGGAVDLWRFDAADSPLGNVLEPIHYLVQLTDADDQSLDQPLEGVIRLQADAPPRVAAGIITRYVLPKATPTVYYRAIDDYGIARVVMFREVIRAGGAAEEAEIEVFVAPGDQPSLRNVEQSYVLDLGPLKLAKGDTVRVTLKATDYRGRNPGRTATADPLVFQVTDEQGILAGMLEADRHSARQLKAMIQRQLGIGGESP